MKIIGKLKRFHRFEIEMDDHELSLLQATLGINSLPQVVLKSFAEYKEDELKCFYDNLLRRLREY